MTYDSSLALGAAIQLPVLGVAQASNNPADTDIYTRFMRHLRCVPTSRMEIKILSSIQFVADMTDHRDDQVAKILVDHGLRAPRMAFPASFLEFCDQLLVRGLVDENRLAYQSIRELKTYWDQIGEGRFAAHNRALPRAAGFTYADTVLR